MQKRRLLATATLIALVFSVGALQPAPIGAAPELAPHTQAAAPYAPPAADGPAAPQWSYAWGFGRTAGAIFAVAGTVTCAPFIWIGAVACGLTGAA